MEDFKDLYCRQRCLFCRLCNDGISCCNCCSWTLTCGCCGGAPCNCSTFPLYYQYLVTYATLTFEATAVDSDIQCAIDAIKNKLLTSPLPFFNFPSASFVGGESGTYNLCTRTYYDFLTYGECQNLGVWGMFFSIAFQDGFNEQLSLIIYPVSDFTICSPCRMQADNQAMEVTIIRSGLTFKTETLTCNYDFRIYGVDSPCDSNLRSFFDMFNGEGIIDILQKKDRI
jgi:hypothetical protein